MWKCKVPSQTRCESIISDWNHLRYLKLGEIWGNIRKFGEIWDYIPKFGEIWVEFWYCYWYHPAVRFNFCFPFCYKNIILLKMHVLVIFICGWRRWWLLQLENFCTEDRRCCSWGHSWFCEWQINFFYMLNGLPVNSSTSNLASICSVWISRLFWDTSRPIRCMKEWFYIAYSIGAGGLWGRLPVGL